jgi:hypothetical protein
MIFKGDSNNSLTHQVKQIKADATVPVTMQEHSKVHEVHLVDRAIPSTGEIQVSDYGGLKFKPIQSYT